MPASFKRITNRQHVYLKGENGFLRILLSRNFHFYWGDRDVLDSSLDGYDAATKFPLKFGPPAKSIHS